MKTNREEILQSALQLFMSMNYERVSLQMITRMVGLTKTGIFNYYPTKLDLFVAVSYQTRFVCGCGRQISVQRPGPEAQV